MSYTISDIVCKIMSTRDTLQFYHWGTKSYAKHKASDELIENLTKNLDRFVEAYLGANKDVKLKITKSFTLESCNDNQLSSCLFELIDYLSDLSAESDVIRSFLRGSSKQKKQIINTDLLNIRDDIMGDIHKTLYLLTLG